MGQEKEDPVLEDEGILLKRMDEDDTDGGIRSLCAAILSIRNPLRKKGMKTGSGK